VLTLSDPTIAYAICDRFVHQRSRHHAQRSIHAEEERARFQGDRLHRLLTNIRRRFAPVGAQVVGIGAQVERNTQPLALARRPKAEGRAVVEHVAAILRAHLERSATVEVDDE
jgi:hypothetical protein